MILIFGTKLRIFELKIDFLTFAWTQLVGGDRNGLEPPNEKAEVEFFHNCHSWVDF